MSGGYESTPQDAILAQIQMLWQAVNEVRGSNGLESFDIGSGGGKVRDGAIEATDTDGNPKARFGKLTGGGHGMEMLVGGQWAPLTALFGAVAATDVAGPSFSGAGDTGWNGYSGADVSFTTYTGKFLLLLISGSTGVSNGTGSLAFAASGAVSIAPDENRAAVMAAYGAGSSYTGSAVYAELITGSPGAVTVSPRYRRIGGAGAGASVWSNRATIVLPF